MNAGVTMMKAISNRAGPKQRNVIVLVMQKLSVLVSHYKLLSYVCVFMAGEAQTNKHQSSEALNCDIFCQSCENKVCIKCPTVG